MKFRPPLCLLTTILLATCILLPIISSAQTVLGDSIRTQLDNGVKGFQERYHSPSVVLLIVHGKDVVYSNAVGYTNLEKKTLATADAKYPVLSLTKLFTSTMMMQLVQRKMVRLDDDVSKYLPDFQHEVAPEDRKVTTLVQLASHASGLPRNSPADLNFSMQVDKWLLGGSKDTVIASSTNQEFLRSLRSVKYEYPKYQFMSYGDRHYSNLGYSILGMALERAAKKDYATYISQNILSPLGMNSSGFTTTAQNAGLAKGYFYDDAKKELIKTPFFQPNSALAAGGLYTTANDLAKFITFQFTTNSSDNDKILSDDYKAMMIALNIDWKPNYPFTIHEGAMLGYRSEIAINPVNKIGWVILTNANDFEFPKMNEYIAKLLMPVFNKKQPALANSKYTGIYKLADSYSSIEIYEKGGQLYSTYLKGQIPENALMSTGNNHFQMKGRGSYNISYEFLQNDAGNITTLNMGQLMWVKQ